MCEKHLWKAVLLQTILDAKSNVYKPRERQAKKEALHWLSVLSRDFFMVCEFADFFPEKTFEKVTKAKKRKFEWQKPEGQGWRTQGMKNHYQLKKRNEIL